MVDRRPRGGHRRLAWGALLVTAAILAALALVLLLRREPTPAPPAPVAPGVEDTLHLPELAPAPVPPATVRPFEERVADLLAERAPPPRAPGGVARVAIGGIVWRDGEGRPLLRAERIVARLDLDELATGDVVVNAATLVAPELFLERDPGEPWNLTQVFAPLFEEEEAPPGEARGPGRAVILRDVVVRDGLVAVRHPGEDLIARDLDAVLPRVAVSVPGEEGPVVRVAALSADVVLPERDVRRRLAVRDARVRIPDDRLAFEAARVVVDGTVIAALEGAYRFGVPGPGLEARARVTGLRAADVAFLFPELDLPPEALADFRIEIEPRPGARVALRFEALDVRAGETVIRGALSLVVGGPGPPELAAVDVRLQPLTIDVLERFVGPLPYQGRLVGRVQGRAGALAFDLEARLIAEAVEEPIRARLVGRAELGPEGFALAALEAELEEVPAEALRAIAPGLPIRGRITGRVALRGPPGRAPLELDVRLSVADGTLAVTGTVDLTGPVPVYDLSGRLVAIELAELLAADVPPVSLTARFTLQGRGTAPRTASARFFVAGRFHGWEAEAGDTLLARGRLDDGALVLDALLAELATARLEAEGLWHLGPGASPGIDYRLAVASLEPFAPFLPLARDGGAGGSFRTEGVLTGSLARPRFEGGIAADSLRLGGWAAGDLSGDYALVLGGAIPVVRLELAAESLETPDAGAFAEARLDARVTADRFAVAATADRGDDGAVDLVTAGRLEVDGTRSALVQRLRFDVGEVAWALARPALIRWGGPAGLTVRGLLLTEVDGEGRVAVDGSLPAEGRVDLEVEVAEFPLGDVLGLLGRPETVEGGELWATFDLGGTRAAPRLEGEFLLLGALVRGVPVDSARGRLRYRGARAALEARLAIAEGGALALEGTVPLELTVGAPPRVRLPDRGGLRLSLVSDSLSLAPLEAISPQVRDVEGVLTGRVEVAGTVEEPRLDGAVFVRDGAATIPLLNERYRRVQAELRLEGRRVTVVEAAAWSDGWVRGSGVVVFEEIDRPVADLTFDFDGFEAISPEDLDGASVYGTLTVVGPLDAPVVAGAVRLDDGNFPLTVFEDPDELEIELDEELARVPGEVPGPGEAEEAPEPVAFERWILDDLDVTVGDDIWFVTEDARVQLSGDLRVWKFEEDLHILGTLEGERGTLVLRAGPIIRRLDIVEARVRFLGSPDVNPAIEITASYIVITGTGGDEVEVLVRVAGTLEEPTVTLASAGPVPIPESELLSLLVFGQPSFALGEAGLPAGALVEETFVGGLAELATIELEEAVLGDLGLPLDVFRIRTTPGPLGGVGAPTVLFGTEVADEVFVTFETGLVPLFGGTAGGASPWALALTWRIDREWRLVLSLEPVDRGRLLRGLGVVPVVTGPDRQLIINLRRRWTY